MPSSYLGKVNHPIPAVMDQGDHVQTFGVKQALWDTKISIPLPQLAYHSLWILDQLHHYLGAGPSSSRKKTETDEQQQIHLMENKPTIRGLQAVYMLIGDYTVGGLIDCGAHCSIMPYSQIKVMNMEHENQPTTSVLKFGGGSKEVPVGCINLELTFDSDLTVTQRFQDIHLQQVEIRIVYQVYSLFDKRCYVYINIFVLRNNFQFQT